MTKDVILKPSRRKEKRNFILVPWQSPAPGQAPAAGRAVAARPLHSPQMFPVHSHDALHPFAELLHLYNPLLLHVLQELRELRERGPVAGDFTAAAHTLGT